MSVCPMCVIVARFPSLSFREVFLAVRCLSLPEVLYGIEEKFIPKEGETC